MKLLLDENLSRRIVPFLQTAFPGSSQVALLGFGEQERFGNLAIRKG
jgi:predicted nuclease of predicted toxin-antitoxin system